ncbi:11245_t:CDS:1, partial [Rhizophagus irregularis]
ANRSLREQLALKKNNEVDRPPPPINNLSQLGSEETLPNLGPTISVGGAEAVSLSQEMPLAGPSKTAPVVKSSLMPYAILVLLLIVVIWFVVRKW